MFNTNPQVARKLKEFGYYNEDLHTIASVYVEKEHCLDDLMSIRNASQMQNMVYTKILGWYRNSGCRLVSTPYVDIFYNVRDSKSHIAKKQRMDDIMRGRRPF